MIIETGDMWQIFNQTDLFCITTNSTITRNDRLVMGRGIALQARNKLPNIDLYLGKQIKFHRDYGLVIVSNFRPQLIAAFQVKYHWREFADLSLIILSTDKLKTYITKTKPLRVDLNYPGIGNGKLNEADVFPLIVELPDCVHIWRFDNG